MPHHVAILRRPYLRLILAGVKTVESRITRQNRAPFGLISPGDVIHFKCSSGPFMAAAVAARVDSFDHLTPARIDGLKNRYNDRVRGDDEYWLAKRRCRYATFITLVDVRPITSGPTFPKSHGIAWFVLSGL